MSHAQPSFDFHISKFTLCCRHESFLQVKFNYFRIFARECYSGKCKVLTFNCYDESRLLEQNPSLDKVENILPCLPCKLQEGLKTDVLSAT